MFVSQEHFISEVVLFFIFYVLIKKRVDVFYKWWFVFFATRVGRAYLQLEKSYLQFEKIKIEKGYVQFEKIKN